METEILLSFLAGWLACGMLAYYYIPKLIEQLRREKQPIIIVKNEAPPLTPDQWIDQELTFLQQSRKKV